MASVNASNGRGRGEGRPFAKGNPGGPGNPFARQVHALRARLYAGVTEDDLAEVVAALLREAKAGKPWAVRELLDRLLGKPAQAVALSGPDGESLPGGISLADVQLAIVESLADEPAARLKVAQALKVLHERDRPSGDGAQP